mgnify:CR=1 FL=1
MRRHFAPIFTLALLCSTALALPALSPAKAEACTTVMMKEGSTPVVAKSYDWDNEAGVVVINKRGVAKAGLIMPGQGPAARWVSKYKSLSFNQFGRELPNGGMNEAGLVVEIMWLTSTRWPNKDARPALNELQWIQYQLDNFASTSEVVSNADKLRVAPVHAQVHYMVCDKGGACATFEYLGGELKVHAGNKLPVAALTNHPYETSVRHWDGVKDQALSQGSGSLSRFARAAQRSLKAGSVKEAWEALDSVANGQTQWQIVYQPTLGKVHFRTRSAQKIRSIDLGAFKASCADAVQVLSMQDKTGGDVTGRFSDYDPARNETLLRASTRKLGGNVPEALLSAAAAYPNALQCKAP